MRTADLSLTPIYRARDGYHGDQPAMALSTRPWFLRDPGSRQEEPRTGYLYAETDRDIAGYSRPIARGHVPQSGIPMLVLSRPGRLSREHADQLVAASEALRLRWNDGVTARYIRETVIRAVGEDASRLLWVELLRPQNIRGEYPVVDAVDLDRLPTMAAGLPPVQSVRDGLGGQRGVCRCGHLCDEHDDDLGPGDHLGECGHLSCSCLSAVDPVGVHASHCCARHGCKYGDQDCPVAAGRVAQDHACEVCSLVEEEITEALREATTAQLRGELARRGDS